MTVLLTWWTISSAVEFPLSGETLDGAEPDISDCVPPGPEPGDVLLVTTSLSEGTGVTDDPWRLRHHPCMFTLLIFFVDFHN